MSLSLEVKKFINSEHTGEYIEIELPGELEVRRPRTKKPRPHLCRRLQNPRMRRAQAHPNLGRRTRRRGRAGEDAPGGDVLEAEPAAEPVPEAQHERARIHYIEAGTGEPLIPCAHRWPVVLHLAPCVQPPERALPRYCAGSFGAWLFRPAADVWLYHRRARRGASPVYGCTRH